MAKKKQSESVALSMWWVSVKNLGKMPAVRQ
jgi:hypothetical protein